jgi:hypothetical protein
MKSMRLLAATSGPTLRRLSAEPGLFIHNSEAEESTAIATKEWVQGSH